MEVDAARRRGPLSDAEKQRRRTNRLCLYCGGPGHIAIHCPHRPRTRQVNQVSASNKVDPKHLVTAKNPSILSNPTDPCDSNNFEILSQLDDLLNE